jgi:LysM repeat protein
MLSRAIAPTPIQETTRICIFNGSPKLEFVPEFKLVVTGCLKGKLPPMQNYNAMPHARRIAFALRLKLCAPIFACALGSVLAACASDPQAGAASSAPVAEDAAPLTPIMPAASVAEASANAGTLSLREDAPLRYVVKKGDTLWSIASYFLRDPWEWPQLWYTNSQVKNPHLIYPGEVLTLVMVDGHTRLAGPEVVEHLSPEARSLSLDQALPAIPIEAIRNFLKGPRLVTAEEIRKAPYLIEYTGEHIDGGANSGIYVRKLPKDDATSTWAIVHIGDEYRDPDTRELLGYEALPAGEAELVTPGDPAQMLITKSNREVLIGDRLLPLEQEIFDASFFPHPPSKPVDGRILTVFDSLIEVPQYHIVALNRGSKAGLDAGTVLAIYQAGRVVQDPYGNKPVQLPEQYAGLLMVFKVTPKVSYALVMSEVRPANVLDKVHAPTQSVKQHH